MGKTVAILLVAACLVSLAAADCYRGFQYDVDLPGGDLGPPIYAYDEADCCHECHVTYGCVAISWDYITEDCYLKGPNFRRPERAEFIVSKQLDLGPARPTTAPPPPPSPRSLPRSPTPATPPKADKCSSGFSYHSQVKGTQIPKESGYPKSTVEECCRDCTKIRGCVAIEYDEKNGACFFFSAYTSFGPNRYSAGFISKVLVPNKTRGD